MSEKEEIEKLKEAIKILKRRDEKLHSMITALQQDLAAERAARARQDEWLLDRMKDGDCYLDELKKEIDILQH
jgi:hypothetical protein